MGSKRPFIAIVDDEESVRRALVRLLRASRVDIEAFATGQEFLTSLQVRQPDCLILDIQMPGLNGRDVQRRLKLTGADLPVVIITAHDEPALREQCLGDGAAAYLRKPLRANTLLNAIVHALGPRFADSFR